jgi:hypothetical protein
VSSPWLTLWVIFKGDKLFYVTNLAGLVVEETFVLLCIFALGKNILFFAFLGSISTMITENPFLSTFTYILSGWALALTLSERFKVSL